MAYYPGKNYGPSAQGPAMDDIDNLENQSRYGALQRHPPWNPAKKAMLLRTGKRAASPYNALLISLFVPWLLYCAIYWIMSFSIHYAYPWICWTFVALALLFVFLLAKLAVDTIAFSGRDGPARGSHWYSFLAITCFIAWTVGVLLGDSNFFYNMCAYYNVAHLADYGYPPLKAIDPSQTSGKQVMDAGRIMFAEDVKVNRSMTMVFRNQEDYCVAPIMTKDSLAPNVSIDFWAVGLNCCTGTKANFQCGEFNNEHARSGLRVLRDDQREYYRLAVQQAQAAYKITANHPLFFFWLENPEKELMLYQRDGWSFFTLGVILYFCFQFLAVSAAWVVFQKLDLL